MSGRSVVLLHGQLIDQMTDWQRHCPSVRLSVCQCMYHVDPQAAPPRPPRRRRAPGHSRVSSRTLSRLLIGAKYNRL